eukprot:scaffold81484_cov31-Tisochrysis_lutea.AAC.9
MAVWSATALTSAPASPVVTYRRSSARAACRVWADRKRASCEACASLAYRVAARYSRGFSCSAAAVCGNTAMRASPAALEDDAALAAVPPLVVMLLAFTPLAVALPLLAPGIATAPLSSFGTRGSCGDARSRVIARRCVSSCSNLRFAARSSASMRDCSRARSASEDIGSTANEGWTEKDH